MSEPTLDEVTMRDLFAMFALITTGNKSTYFDQQARFAYSLADAMLRERGRNENE